MTSIYLIYTVYIKIRDLHVKLILPSPLDELTKKVKYLLVLEYADSGTLRKYLKNKSKIFEWKNQLKFAKETASAILCLHENGILHRDLVSFNFILQNLLLLNLIVSL